MRYFRAVAIALLVLGSAAASAQSPGYQLPPKEIVDIVDAPLPPSSELSPTRDVLAVLEGAKMPTIEELSRPVLRLGGRRINPRTNGPHRAQLYRSITLKSIDDTAEKKVTLPAN